MTEETDTKHEPLPTYRALMDMVRLREEQDRRAFIQRLDYSKPAPGTRAAAWAWHDRRLALHERLRSGLGDRLGRCDGLDFWPVILAWSDAQVVEVERWLLDSTAEMPEVLRG